MGKEPWQFHFAPESYLEMVIAEIPAYEELEDFTAEATVGVEARRILDLGVGTGETAVRVAGKHPSAHLIGIDESPDMIDHARRRLPHADLRVGKLEDSLPTGNFDLIVSALSVHHLDGPGKADLFKRIVVSLCPGGRFVLADVVVPENAADVVIPIDGVYDKPSRMADQLLWLGQAGLDAEIAWAKQDLAILVAERPS